MKKGQLNALIGDTWLNATIVKTSFLLSVLLCVYECTVQGHRYRGQS